MQNISDKCETGLCFQICHLVLFEASVACALWQKGHVNMTLAIMASAPLAMYLSRIPMRYFPALPRQLVQLVFAGLAFAWLQQRSMRCPLDVAIIECSAIIVEALFIGGLFHEYMMLSTVAIAFAGYGGLAPGRTMYAPSLMVACVAFAIILYISRYRILDKKAAGFSMNLPAAFLHALLVIIVAFYCLVHVPIKGSLRSRGLIPVSYNSYQRLIFPDLVEKWLDPALDLFEGKEMTEVEKEQAAEAFQEKLADMKAVSENLESFDARNGNGNGNIGTDLVFRAYAAAKLYWVLQMYDTYDGSIWTRSNSLLQGNGVLDQYIPPQQFEVNQMISIEKPLSTHLPYAFHAVKVMLRERFDIARRYAKSMYIAHPDAVSYVLQREIHEPPWQYRVNSFVPDGSLESADDLGAFANYGWNYRKLPDNSISERLRKLAKSLTDGVENPKKKAEILRDYLRDNFEYELEPPPIPKDKEVVDYFLFERKKGNCQQFSQALVVLARLSGLHARLVTGFSPGTYNVLANCFEVYEYNAHAWTQIFIPPYGWLTFDGVAPGDMELPEHKNILNSMLDPFGKEWKNQTPELSYKPLPSQKALKLSDLQRKHIRENPNFQQTTSLTHLPKEDPSANPDRQTMKGQIAKAFESIQKKVDAIVQGIENIIGHILEFIDWIVQYVTDCFRKYGIILWPLLGLGTVVSILIIIKLRFIRHWLMCRYVLFKCRRMLKKAGRSDMSPGETVILCQKICSELLGLQKERMCSMDLLEYACAFDDKSISDCASAVAEKAVLALYGKDELDGAAVDMVFRKTGELYSVVASYP